MKTIVVELSRAFIKAASGLGSCEDILVVKPEPEIEGLFEKAISGPMGLRPGSREDYEKINVGDELCLDNIRAVIENNGEAILRNITKSEEYVLDYDLSSRQRDILLAGGLLDYTRENSK